MTALVVTLLAVLLLCLRVPVGFALLVPSLGYILFASSMSLTAAMERIVSSLNSFPLLAVPLFILVGYIANNAGLAERLFAAAQLLVGRVRGGLGYVNVLSSLGFSWMSGSAVSDVAVMATVQVPQMQKRGYSNRFIAGITGAASLVTPVMPPSIPAIMYGVASGVSIGALFMAAVIPAFLLVAVLCLSVWIYARKRDELRGAPAEPGRLRVYLSVIPVMLAPIIVLGGILGGIFTPTEAAAVTVAYLIVVSVVVYRSLSWKGFLASLRSTFSTTASIMFLVAASSLFGWVLTMERVPAALADLVMGLTDNPVVFMLLVLVVLLLIGMVMEPVSAVLITTPVLLPVALELGVDPVHFGIFLVFTLLIGLFTPPVGLVLFVMESVTTLKSSEILRGVLPFVAIFIGLAILLILVPGLTLWLPSLMG